MKKYFIFWMLLYCVVVFGCVGCSTGEPQSVRNEEEFFLSYLAGEPQVKGNKLYVNGLFSNGSPKYDIVGLNDIQIVVTDKNGNEQTRVALNTQFANNCVIAPYGTAAYNFTCDVSDFTVQSIWDLRYEVIGEYAYIECQGSQCAYCGGNNSNISYPIHETTSEYETITCSNCNGSGVCTECNGSGRNDYSGVLAGYGCTLCDKTGRCHKCGGSGSVKIY